MMFVSIDYLSPVLIGAAAYLLLIGFLIGVLVAPKFYESVKKFQRRDKP